VPLHQYPCIIGTTFPTEGVGCTGSACVPAGSACHGYEIWVIRLKIKTLQRKQGCNNICRAIKCNKGDTIVFDPENKQERVNRTNLCWEGSEKT